MRVATWNVNSLKVRLPRVEEWLADIQPDVLCMQETKLADEAFPALTFGALGYECAHFGQGQWNGVAILSKVGLDDVVMNFVDGGEPDADARIMSARCGGTDVTSVYVPERPQPGQPALPVQAEVARPTEAARRGAHDARSADDRRRRLQHRTDRRRRVRPEQVRRGHPHQSGGTAAPRRAVRLGTGRPVPPAVRRRPGLQLVGLPGRRLPPGPRPAHRPDARLPLRRRSPRSGV